MRLHERHRHYHCHHDRGPARQHGDAVRGLAGALALLLIVVCGAALLKDEARVSLEGVPDEPGVSHRVFSAIADQNIAVDMIVQNAGSGGKASISFTVLRNELQGTLAVLGPLAAAMGICACATYFLVVLAAFLLPETRGRDLRSVTTGGESRIDRRGDAPVATDL